MEIPNYWTAVTIEMYLNSSPAQTKKQKEQLQTNTHTHTHSHNYNKLFQVFQDPYFSNSHTLESVNGTFTMNQCVQSIP